MAKTLAMV